MRIGILLTAYNCIETINQCIQPWLLARTSRLDNNDYVISTVSVPFQEYKDIASSSDETTGFLKGLFYQKSIDYLISGPLYINEAEARNLALRELLGENVDLVILVDGDEIYTEQDIRNIVNFIELDRWISWFSFSLKNYVFDDNTYLIDPFTPPRAFRTHTNGMLLKSFTWDNDVKYIRQLDDAEIDFRALPTKTIPKRVAWVKHLTWLNTEKTKRKVEYQLKHFNGVCGYRWNYEANKLEFNPSIPIPLTSTEC